MECSGGLKAQRSDASAFSAVGDGTGQACRLRWSDAELHHSSRCEPAIATHPLHAAHEAIDLAVLRTIVRAARGRRWAGGVDPGCVRGAVAVVSA